MLSRLAGIFKFGMRMLIVSISLLQNRTMAQLKVNPKSVIDFHAIETWPRLSKNGVWISSKGNYFGYQIEKPGLKSIECHIASIDGNWEKSLGNIFQMAISYDEKLIVYQQNDKLYFLRMGDDTCYKKLPILTCLVPKQNHQSWIAYEKNDTLKNLVLFNMISKQERYFGQVSKYLFDDKGQFLIFERKITRNGQNLNKLYLIDLLSGEMKNIWVGKSGEDIDHFDFSYNKNVQFTFNVTAINNTIKERSLWIYQVNDENASLLFDENDCRNIHKDLIVPGVSFSANGKWVFFNLSAPQNGELPIKSTDSVQINIWSYKDETLYPKQIQVHRYPNQFKCAISVDGNYFHQLEADGLNAVDDGFSVKGNYILMCQNGSSQSDILSYKKQQYFIQSLIDPKKRIYGTLGRSLFYHSFSPDGHWMIFYDPANGNYFSCDLISGKILSLTGKLKTPFNSDNRHDMVNPQAAPIAGWLRNTSDALIFDNYDLWEIDVTGKKLPINLTQHFGVSHHLKLRFFETGETTENQYESNQEFLLTGFNVQNQYNGFFRFILGGKNKPILLTMGPFTYYRVRSQKPVSYSFDDGMKPVKALNVKSWLILRQSATEAPNLFITNDFENFKQLTNLDPQKKYNWLTSELIHYRQLDGSLGQGVLYKPENFNSHKKYPLIFNCYEDFSHRLYEYPRPELMTSNIDISWFTSRGYLVFTPDIKVKPAIFTGKTPGQFALNSISGAVKTLSHFSFVDLKHLGIQGHSFGAQLTNYMITHSHLFAAASSMAGVSDEISSYLGLLRGWNNNEQDEDMYIKEIGQVRLGATLWQKPNFYLRETTVLKSNMISAPYLLINNVEDGAVSWRQGLEMYLALRRLRKPCWLLQYDKEGHDLYQKKNQEDYSIRLTQFFDYYLKGAPPAKWMTQGIPAWKKGIETGYELDTSGAKP